MEYIIVDTATFRVGRAPQVLKTSGIGSCIVVCVHDTQSQIGALGHMMLPHQYHADLIPTRYVDTTIPLMIHSMRENGASISNLVARIAGGANMFPALWSDEGSIGAKNIAEARKVLGELGIPIVKQDVGGTKGRNLEFRLESGTVIVT